MARETVTETSLMEALPRFSRDAVSTPDGYTVVIQNYNESLRDWHAVVTSNKGWRRSS